MFMLHTHMRNEMIIIYAKGHWRVHSNKSTRWIKGRRKKHLIVLGAAWSRMWSNDLINCLRSWRSAQLSCKIRENNKSYPKMYAYHGIFCLTPTQSPCVWIVMDSIFFVIFTCWIIEVFFAFMSEIFHWRFFFTMTNAFYCGHPQKRFKLAQIILKNDLRNKKYEIHQINFLSFIINLKYSSSLKLKPLNASLYPSTPLPREVSTQ